MMLRLATTSHPEAIIANDVDTSAANLSTYDDLWHTEVVPEMRIRLLVSRLLYRAPNDRLDTSVRDLRRMDADELAEADGGSIRHLATLSHVRDVPLLARVLLDSRN